MTKSKSKVGKKRSKKHVESSSESDHRITQENICRSSDVSAEGSDIESNSEEYVVEKILDQRIIDGRRKYLLKWEGYPHSANTWEYEENLNCPLLLKEFEEREFRKAQLKEEAKALKKQKTGDSEQRKALSALDPNTLHNRKSPKKKAKLTESKEEDNSQNSIEAEDVPVSEALDWISKQLGYRIASKSALHIKSGKFYVPPLSPHHLIQEIVFHDPWKLLVTCILLNRTSSTQVKSVIYHLFTKYPTPQHIVDDPYAEEFLRELITPLGLNKRALYIIEISKQILNSQWTDAKELCGIGKYGDDAYRIFCCGLWNESQPQDHKLTEYHTWISSVNGEESATQREENISQICIEGQLVWRAHTHHDRLGMSKEGNVKTGQGLCLMLYEEKEWWDSLRTQRTKFAVQFKKWQREYAQLVVEPEDDDGDDANNEEENKEEEHEVELKSEKEQSKKKDKKRKEVTTVKKKKKKKLKEDKENH